jgi:hypothetical protein
MHPNQIVNYFGILDVIFLNFSQKIDILMTFVREKTPNLAI